MATHQQRSIQDEDESVLIAVRALGDMRNRALLHSHPPSTVACAYLSLPSPNYAHLLPFTSFTTDPSPLRCLFLKLSDPYHSNPGLGRSPDGP